MLSDDISRRELRDISAGPISWWSWRPGIKPQSALLLGIPLAIFALLLLLLGLTTLVAGIEDSSSAPWQIPGTVVGHSMGTTTSQPQIAIHLHKTPGFPDTITLAAPANAIQRFSINTPITVVYSQRLHFAYALEYAGQRYTLVGVSAAGNPIGSLAFLLLGLIALPYPVLLAHWGWRDLLIERYDQGRLYKMTAQVVDTRAISRTRIAQPGFAARGSRPWYGIALLPHDAQQPIFTFSVSKELYESVQKDALVTITYSPHLHYIYTLKALSTSGNS